jgi:RND family efflux transporter MFP subunit
MSADANMATRLRSLAIDRPDSPPASAAASRRLAIRCLILASVIAIPAAIVYLPSKLAIDTPVKYSSSIATSSVSPATADTSSRNGDTVSAVPIASLPQAVIGSGYVVAGRMITLRPEVGGKVVSLPLDVGDHFIAGQVIARLDTTTSEIELKISRSQAAAALIAVQRNQISLAKAQRTLARTKQLADRGAASQSNLDTDELAVLQLSNDLDSARQAAETARLQVERQENTISLHRIVAPFDGVIVARLAGLGDMVASGTDGGGPRDGIATLLDPASLAIDVDIAQSNAARIEAGRAAIAVLDAFPDRQFKMRVTTIVPVASMQKGTVTARLEFLTAPSGVLPNMAAKVTLNPPSLQAKADEKGN